MQRLKPQAALAGIVCPVCNSDRWRTRYARRLVDHIERRRECLQCGERLTTEERRKRDISNMRVHNANNPKQPPKPKPDISNARLRIANNPKQPPKPKPEIKFDNVKLDSQPKTGNSRIYLEEPARLPQPTSALPGSAAKIELLRQRVERGEHLWHPLDRQTAPEPGRDIRQDCTPLCELVA